MDADQDHVFFFLLSSSFLLLFLFFLFSLVHASNASALSSTVLASRQDLQDCCRALICTWSVRRVKGYRYHRIKEMQEAEQDINVSAGSHVRQSSQSSHASIMHVVHGSVLQWWPACLAGQRGTPACSNPPASPNQLCCAGHQPRTVGGSTGAPPRLPPCPGLDAPLAASCQLPSRPDTSSITRVRACATGFYRFCQPEVRRRQHGNWHWARSAHMHPPDSNIDPISPFHPSPFTLHTHQHCSLPLALSLSLSSRDPSLGKTTTVSRPTASLSALRRYSKKKKQYPHLPFKSPNINQ